MEFCCKWVLQYRYMLLFWLYSKAAKISLECNIFFFKTYLICHLIQKLADMCDGFSQFLKSNWPLAMLSITIFDRTAMFLQNHRANLYLEDIRSFINSQFLFIIAFAIVREKSEENVSDKSPQKLSVYLAHLVNVGSHRKSNSRKVQL